MRDDNAIAKNAILLHGPTASGKSELALALADFCAPAVIINADSMQVYDALACLTAQPEHHAMRQVPHHLYGFIDARWRFSVGQWYVGVQACLEGLAPQVTPIIVGGTGLYFHSLTQGLAHIPPIPPSIADDIRVRHEAQGTKALYDVLAKIDSQTAERIHQNDYQRIIRALEVYEASGVPLSHWHSETPPPRIAHHVLELALMPSRDWLYERANARFDTMLAAGVVDEVEALLARDLSPRQPIMKAHGLRNIAAYLRGRLSLAAATAAAKQETRNYAKRQLTWMRNKFITWETINEQFYFNIEKKIIHLLQKTLDI